MIEIRRFQGIDWISLKVHLADKEAAVKERDEWHIQQFRSREAQRDKTEATLREQITALQECEKVLIQRCQTHGDIETDKEEKPVSIEDTYNDKIARKIWIDYDSEEALRGEEERKP